jgi:hypothetical protein
MRDSVVFLARGCSELESGWRGISVVGFRGPSAPDPVSGEDWQYMGTVRSSSQTVRGSVCCRCRGMGKRLVYVSGASGVREAESRPCFWCGGVGFGTGRPWAHQFRHRCYPGTGKRVYLNIPASEGWRPESRRGSAVAS